MINTLSLTWSDIQSDTDVLSDKLRDKLVAPLHDYTCVTVARGGLIPAGLLAYRIGIRSIEAVSVRSYTNKERGDFELIRPINTVLSEKSHIIVVDDLSDTGQTFAQLRQFFPNAIFACLYAKPLGQKNTDVYAREISQNTWVAFPWDTKV